MYIVRPASLLFGLIPYSQPPCLIAYGPISSIAKDPLYAQGSDAGICTSDYCRAGTSIASSLLILPGSKAETVKLHQASMAKGASGNEVRLIVVEGWLAGSPAL